MEKDFRRCRICGTENEEEYNFCKNCGAPLEAANSENRGPSVVYTNDFVVKESFRRAEQKQYGSNSFGQDNRPQDDYRKNGRQDYQPSAENPAGEQHRHNFSYGGFIDGIPVNEVAEYVGTNSYKYINKFINMEITGGKAGWLWAPAILSFLLGPLGASLWFFYRKMPKIAAIFVSIAIVLFSFQMFFISDSAFEVLYDSSYYSDSYLSVIFDFINTLSTIIRFASMLISAIFGCYFYKRSVIVSIYKLRMKNVDPRYYHFVLNSSGGTSAGWLAFGIIVPLIAMFIISYIMTAVAVVL